LPQFMSTSEGFGLTIDKDRRENQPKYESTHTIITKAPNLKDLEKKGLINRVKSFSKVQLEGKN